MAIFEWRAVCIVDAFAGIFTPGIAGIMLHFDVLKVEHHVRRRRGIDVET